MNQWNSLKKLRREEINSMNHLKKLRRDEMNQDHNINSWEEKK
jgi:hypothetical protein